MAEYILPLESEVEKRVVDALITRAIFILDKDVQSDEGIDYKPLYYGLNKGINAIISNAATYEQVIANLKLLQCAAEEAFLEQGD